MRVLCFLRDLRGESQSLRDVEDATGINRAYLSRYERGQQFPPDREIPVLEQAYGAPAHQWYASDVLLAIQTDEVEQ